MGVINRISPAPKRVGAIYREDCRFYFDVKNWKLKRKDNVLRRPFGHAVQIKNLNFEK